ncbi:hypothetical protein JCM8097_003244 [Rhodosporidiobolus ruineniae]
MDTPLPLANNQPRPIAVQQQRPSLTYFLFLSLLFYLINTSGPAPQPFRPDSGDTSDPARAYRAAQDGLLFREAKIESLARWLGTSNETSPWLNSTFYPEVAIGTAPPPHPPAPVEPAEGNSTAPGPLPFRGVRLHPFQPSHNPELPPVPPLVQHIFSSPARQAALREPAARVFPQNLTGFGKGTWETKRFGWGELGLNETWEEKVEVPVEPKEGGGRNATGEAGPAVNETLATEVRVVRRQGGIENATQPLKSTSPEGNFTVVTLVHNRTALRGSFSWTDDLSSPSTAPDQQVSLNLRSVQTSAVGPVKPLREGTSETDDGELLEVRPAVEEWEREGPVVYLGAQLELKSADGEHATSLDLEAAHFLSSGLIYGYATPRSVPAHLYEAISLPFALSSSPPSDPAANRTATALGHAMLLELRERLGRSVRNLEDSRTGLGGGSGGGIGDDDDEPVEKRPQCIFSFFGALDPLPPSFAPSLYAESYASLFHPSGSSAPTLPPARLSALLSSENCGLVLSLPSVAITHTQVYWSNAVVFVVALAAASTIIVVALVRQLERVQSRPGTIGNVSGVMVAAMCMIDGYVGVTLLTVGVVIYTRTSAPLLAAAFFTILGSLLFGLRYLALIREAIPPPTPAAVPAPAAASADEGDGGGDGENAATEGLLSGEPQERQRRDGLKQKILFGTPIGLFTLGLYVLIQHGWLPLFLGLVYSYWVPQIVLNVRRGTARQSLSPEFVIGNTAARLLMPVYFYGYEGNCWQIETSRWIYLLVAYSSAQAILLLLQQRLSSPSSLTSSTPSLLTLFLPTRLLTPLNRLLTDLSHMGGGSARFFLPRSLCRILDLPVLSSWDYHPLAPPETLLADLLTPAGHTDDLEAGHGDGDTAPASPYSSPDCPICLSPVQVVPTKADHAAGPARVDEVRRECAITPCRHVVHTECFEQWMLVRAICPVCRSALPPLR